MPVTPDATELVTRYYAAFNKHDLAAYQQLFRSDCVVTAPGGVTRHGLDGLRTFDRAFIEAFPDGQITSSRMVANGAVVMSENRFRGTFTGPLRTAEGETPPTGRRIDWPYVGILEAAGDRLRAQRIYGDLQDWLAQLGLLASQDGRATTEVSKALARRFFDDFLSRGQTDVADEVLAPGVVDYDLPPGLPPGREGTKQFFALLRRGLPDLKLTIEDQIAERDTVVSRLTLRATHLGDLMGIAATGKPVTIKVIDIHRIADGQIVEYWGQADFLGLLQQIGAIPAIGQPLAEQPPGESPEGRAATSTARGWA